MEDTITIALVQTRRGRSWGESLNLVLSFIERNTPHAEVLFINENWLSREPVNIEDYEYSVERLSSAFSGDIFAGINYVRDRDGVVRSVGLALVNGRIVRSCEKIFPSTAVGERGRVQGGRLLKPISSSGWRISCVACVDIFYPELSRIYALNGAELIFNPASIPSDRIDLWHAVLRTRASENTVYTVGVNSVGYVYPDGRLTLGGSVIYAPNAALVGQAGTREAIEEFTLHRQVIQRIRERWAFYSDLSGPIRRRIFKDIETLIGRQLLDGSEQTQ
ncbi:MAG: carbon-nitrogen hydrolase family protein [Desulfurococcales archaeon]|nr:carbon-nitrogen hydrolase family protein [Desulfurococcales archaeon]